MITEQQAVSVEMAGTDSPSLRRHARSDGLAPITTEVGTYSRVLRVLAACECSGEVRREFRTLGHDAFSCDLLPAEDGETKQHFVGDVRDVLDSGWDLIIAFPPCTHLCSSGARWFAKKQSTGEQQAASGFFFKFVYAPAKHIAIENPVGVMSSRYRKPDQIIQPWQFGHGETKATRLWLKNLPKLIPTNIVSGREDRIHRMPPGPNRSKDRSRTYPGIAKAMAEQWSNYILTH